MSADAIPEPIELPCGCRGECRVVEDRREFVFRPCSLECEYLRFVVEETRAIGNPVVFAEGTA